MKHEFELAIDPSQDDRAAIVRGLVAFNDLAFGPSNISPLAVLVRDDAGQAVGGLWGRVTYDWLYVELLFVPEALRGQGLGARLIAFAEDEARARGAANAWIDCFATQTAGSTRRAATSCLARYPASRPAANGFFSGSCFSPS